jgi:cytidylate kinase
MNNPKPFSITIDGPVASGKSTIGRMLAKKLGYYYIYSGALYRALAYLLIHSKGYTHVQLHYPKMSDVLALLDPDRFTYQYDVHSQERVFFDAADITPYLKDSSIDQAASIVSTDPQVRDEINKLIRLIAEKFDVVVDGRDAGTVIFPHASAKFYLTASLDVRAGRWQEAQKKIGNVYMHEQALQLLAERDKRDQERKVAPLMIPDDAIVVDNSELDAEQTLAEILNYIK